MYTKKKCKIYVLSVLLCTFFFSCSSIDFELPQGPQGTNGKSAYEIWKEEVETGHINWPSTQVDLADFLVYIKGEKGDKGKDGMSAYDQWKILITQGNVTNPHDPSLIWPSSKNTEADFWDFLSGRDGQSPHIGENGNWYIGNKDTEIKAIGKDGKNGINGKDGLSAYELCIIRKTKCFDFWERNVLFPKTKRSFFRTPKHPLPCPFPLNFSLLIITKKFGNLAKNRYICIV